MYGLRKADGKWLTASSYSSIRILFADKYLVIKDEKTGIIDSTGKTIILCEYDYIDKARQVFTGENYGREDSIDRVFFDNSFLVRKENIYGVLSAEGTTIIPVHYISISDFYNGTAYATDSSRQITFWERKGFKGYAPENSVVIMNTRELLQKKNRFSFRITDTSRAAISKIRWGVCNDSGKVIIAARWDWIGTKGNPIHAIVCERNKYYHLLSSDGIELLPDSFTEITSAGIEMVIVSKNGKSGVIGPNARIIIPPEYSTVEPVQPFNRPVSFLVVQDKKMGYFDSGGKMILKPEFDLLTACVSYDPDSLKLFFLAKKEGRWGAVCPDGNVLESFQFDTAFSYNNGYLFWSPQEVSFLQSETHTPWAVQKNMAKRPAYAGGVYGNEISYEGFVPQLGDTVRYFRTQYEDQDDSLIALNDSINLYRFGISLGHYSDFTISNCQQTTGIDSSWFILQFIFNTYIKTDTVYPYSIYKSSSGPPKLFQLNNETKKGNICYYSASPKNYKVNTSNIIISSEGRVIFDSVKDYTVYGPYFDGKSKMYFGLVRSYFSKLEKLVDSAGNNLLPEDVIEFNRYTPDSVWIKKRTDHNTSCGYAWNLYSLSEKRELLLPENELGYPFYANEKPIDFAYGLKGIGLLDAKTFRFIMQPVYAAAWNLSDQDSLYMISSHSGKTGFLTQAGTLAIDTSWDKVIILENPETDAAGHLSFGLLLISKKQKALFTNEGLALINDSLIAKTIGQARRDPGNNPWTLYNYYQDYGKIRMAVADSVEFTSWQNRLLFDSIFLSPLTPDCRNVEPNDNTIYTNKYEQNCGSSYPINYKYSPYETTHEIGFVNENFLCLRRTSFAKRGYSSETNPTLLSYQNYFLRPNGPEDLSLSALFATKGWERIIIDTLFTYLGNHPELEAPCLNPDQYIQLLEHHYTLSAEGLSVFPEWEDKQHPEKIELEILIPWEKLKPYLRADVASKIGI